MPVHLRARDVRDHVLMLEAVVVRYQRLLVGTEHHVPPVHKLLRLKTEKKKTPHGQGVGGMRKSGKVHVADGGGREATQETCEACIALNTKCGLERREL